MSVQLSVLMAPKLLEMDQIVKIIHTSIIQMQESDQGNMLLVSAFLFFLIVFLNCGD